MGDSANETIERIDDIDLKALMALYSTHTTVDADQIVKGSRGKRVAVEGLVYDSRPMIGKSVFVFIDTTDGIHIALIFESKDTVSHLRKKQFIKATGHISDVDRSGVTLENAELLS